MGFVQRKRCSEIPARQRNLMTSLVVLLSWGLCARPGSAHMPNADWILLALHVVTMLVLVCRMQGSFSLRRILSIPVTQQAVTSGLVSSASISKRPKRNSSTPLCKIVSFSGPKAGGGSVRSASPGKGLQRLLAITTIMCLAEPTTGVRVVGVTMASTGVTESALLNSHTNAVAKQHGSPNMGSSFSSIRKRSFKRACRRAARQGGAWYRGQWLTDGELPRPADTPAPKRKQHTIKCVKQGGRRLYVMCWNVGGLSTGLFDELLAWLALPQQTYISAVLLQETHWQHQSEWCSGNWTCVHSGDPSHKYAGVMCMLSNNCFQPQHVRHQTLIDGRLLHVRAGALDDAVDFFCLYQHPWNVRVPKPELHARRDKVWKRLDRAISAQPKRNLLVIGGDFNVQLGPHGRAVGTAVQHRHAHDQIAEDHGRLTDIITMHDLCAVNTWRGPKSSMITYQMGTHGTQIDFLLTRIGRADALAKTSRPMQDFPVADWRLGGQHIPLLASFRTNLKPWMHKSAHNTPKRTDLCNLRSDDPWILRFRQSVDEQLQGSRLTAEGINTALNAACARYFPQIRKPKDVAHHANDAVLRPIKHLWQLWRSFKQVQREGDDLKCCFQVWRAFQSFKKQKKVVQKAGRESRKAKVDTLLNEAAAAASRQDMRGLYQVVRKLAPKQEYKRVQIHSQQGQILTPGEEIEELKVFFTNVYSGETYTMEFETPCEIPSVEALESALCKVRTVKAVPIGCAPTALWKHCAPVLAKHLHQLLGDLWDGRAPTVPQLWKDCWITLLAKPGKRCKRPESLRPIALQCVGGKTVLRTICQTIKPAVYKYLQNVPQYAYMAGRDGVMALLRAFNHFGLARDLLQSQVRTIHNIREGCLQADLVGGIALSIDLSQAFDKVPRDLMIQALKSAGVPSSTCYLIHEWHRQSVYRLRHNGHVGEIPTFRGVRQGCVLSPIIWSCITGYLTKLLAEEVGETWCCQCLTTYADDNFAAEIVRNPGDLQQALMRFGLLMDVLEDHKLQVNLEKSAILMKVAGKHKKAVLKEHTISTKEGFYIAVPGKRGVRLLPWVDEHKYMGAMLSYDSFQSATFLHRLESCRNNYQRLRKFLHRRQHLTLAQRVQMWRTCVWSSLRYALHATGLTSEHVLKIRGVVATHLRAIACSPRHLTGETNSSLHARLGVLDPVEQLFQESGHLVSRLHALGRDVDSTLAWAPEILQQAERVQQLLQTQVESGAKLIPVDADCGGVPCPHCGIYFLSERALATHTGHKHPEVLQQAAATATTLQQGDLGVDGMPICARCGAKFHSWQTLKRHVRKGRCKAMQQPGETARSELVQQELAVPISRRYQLLQSFQDGGFELVLSHEGLVDELKRHCCICRQWIGDVRHMKLHMRNSHGDLWNQHQTLALEQCGRYSVGVNSTCRFCAGGVASSNRARHAKMCTVLFQIAFACEIAISGGHVSRRSGGGRLHASFARAAGETAARAERGHGGGCRQGQEGEQVQRGQGQEQLEGCQKEGGGVSNGRGGQTTQFQSGGDEATAERSSGTMLAARGQLEPSSSGQGIRVVSKDKVPRELAKDHVRHKHTMEAEQGNGSGHLTASGSSSQMLRHRAAGQTGKGGPGRANKRVGDKGGMGDSAGHGRTVLALLSVRSTDQTGMCGRQQSPDSTCPGHRRSEGHPGSTKSGHAAQVPCDKAACGAVRVRDDKLPDPCSSQRRPFGAVVSSASSAGAQFHPVSDGGKTAERAHTTLAAGEPCGQPAVNEVGALDTRSARNGFQRVCQMILHNPDNQCYQNTFMLGVLWSTLRAQGGDVSYDACCSGALLGRFVVFCNKLVHLCRHTRLMAHIEWTSLLVDWRRPTQQHDIAEFATHIFQKLRLPAYQGAWHARALDGEVRDIGDTNSPIVMQVDGCTTLQSCISRWSNQSLRHALNEAPKILCVQLARFTQAGRRFRKNFHPILPGAAMIPVFSGPGADTHSILYQVAAIAMHHGATPTSGHYRCVFFPSECAVNAEPGCENPSLEGCFITDDGVVATPIDQGSSVGEVHTCCYLCWFIRM